MRFDRLLTLYFFCPLLKFKQRSNEPRIAILMYHSVSKPNGTFSRPYYEVCTSPETFETHMKFLYENNYQVISLLQVLNLLNQPGALNKHNKSYKPVKPYVVLTFDDGFRDFYTQAAPVLQKYGFTASVFLPTAYIGDEGKRKRFNGKMCLTWNEVRRLTEQGFSFGSHTVTHPKLIEFTRREIEYELCHSMEVIKKNTGLPTDTFCYPYSFPQQNRIFLNTLSSIMQECGYQVALTTKIGTICPENVSLFLPRIPVNDFDDNIFLARKLDGSYDWTQKLQSLYKRILKTRITSC